MVIFCKKFSVGWNFTPWAHTLLSTITVGPNLIAQSCSKLLLAGNWCQAWWLYDVSTMSLKYLWKEKVDHIKNVKRQLPINFWRWLALDDWNMTPLQVIDVGPKMSKMMTSGSFLWGHLWCWEERACGCGKPHPGPLFIEHHLMVVYKFAQAAQFFWWSFSRWKISVCRMMMLISQSSHMRTLVWDFGSCLSYFDWEFHWELREPSKSHTNALI